MKYEKKIRKKTLPKIENSSDFVHYFLGRGPKSRTRKKKKRKNIRLRGHNSCSRTPKSMREPTPELNGSIKDKKGVLKF